MKNYKKAALATMVLAAMPLLAATSDTPIKVTTFADEDGENASACSLREALKTAEIRKAYGGCEVTDIRPTTRKLIQLEAGTYLLQSELVPNVDVSIFGKIPEDWQNKNVINNDYPAKTQLTTVIKAQNANRLFNTTVGKKALALTNIALTGGQTNDRGGAIYAGADIILQNTQILNSQAAKEGGAIFLAGTSASLTITNSLIQGNQSPKASVLAMSCFNDNVYSKRKINISGSSLVQNGSTASSSTLEFCGEPEGVLSTNTIAKNTANTTNGSIIKFTGDAVPGGSINSSLLSDGSSLELESNTIVENTAHATLLYDKMGGKLLTYNLIAYNSSYACRYLLGAAKAEKLVGIGLAYNALALGASDTKKCDIPDESVPVTNTTNIDISTVTDVRTLLSSLQPASEANNFLPLYYPKVGVDTAKDLIDTGTSDCSATDQRGIARLADGTLHFNPQSANSCDIGSVEWMKLTAGDLTDLSNQSLTGLIASYQNEHDFFENLVANPNNPDFLTYYKVRLQEFKTLIEKTKANLKYRAIYIDLKKYQLPIPHELDQADGTRKLQFFSKDLYTVTTEALGVGQINATIQDVTFDPNLVCEWNADLEQIIVYRKDDVITQAGDKVFCKYTVTLKSDTSVKSSGLVQAAFINIAPVAESTSVTMKYQQNQKLSVNLLDFANDEGDSGEGGSGPVTNPNKPQFWRNAAGVELPIHLKNVPTKNLIVTADREGPCPSPDQEQTCYGGNIYIQEANNFNPFNFSFDYQVYDADGMASNTAAVRVISTATTTDDTRTASGGGSMGMFGVFGAFGLLAYRRWKK